MLFTVFTGRAQAYIDPGTGSYIFQLLIAGFLAGIFFIKTFWTKIKLWINGILGHKSSEETSADNESNQ